MSALTISFIGFSAILILAFLRFPLALSMGLVGVIGFGELTNYRAAITVANDPLHKAFGKYVVKPILS